MKPALRDSGAPPAPARDPLRRFAFATAIALGIGNAVAGQSESIGPGGPIPDNSPTGITTELTVTLAQAETVDAVIVRIEGFNHGWCGEIEITLEHVDSGRTAVLVERIGATAAAPDGDSSNFVGQYDFSSDSMNDIWAAAAAVGAAGAIPNRDYQPSSAASGADNQALDVFLNQNPVGTWRLRIADRTLGINGSFTGWRLLLGRPPVCQPCADANCDGFVTVSDIGAFVTALTDLPAWEALFPDADRCAALCSLDTNRDGQITVGDIGAFVAALTGTPCGV